MRKLILFILSFILCLSIYGQKPKGIWVLGYKRVNNRAVDLKEATKIIRFYKDSYYITELDSRGNIKPGRINKLNNFVNYEFTSPGTMVIVNKITDTVEFWIKIDNLNKNIRKEIKNDKRRIEKRNRRSRYRK